MTNTNIKSLNYTQFQEFVYELLEKKEIEVVKAWDIARVLYKDSSMTKLENLNIVQIRSRWTKKYNILVSKEDFKNAIEGVAEEITPRPDNIDEWISEVYDYLETNKITKIKLKDLALKVFNLNSKELNMPTQHRLGSILRNLGYVRNTKTKEWVKVKTGDTDDTNTLEPIASDDSKGITEVSLGINTNPLKPIASKDLDSSTEVSSLKTKIELLTKQLSELQQASNNDKEFTIKLNHKNLELEKQLKNTLTKITDLESQLENKNKDNNFFSYDAGFTSNPALKNKATPVVEVANISALELFA